MNLLSKLRTAVHDPRIVWRRLVQTYFSLQEHNGIKVMEKDWDNLVILDACRYDLFEDVFPHDGCVGPVISGGSDTSEFLKHNFSQRNSYDTVYITANPHVQRLGLDESFHACIPLWKSHWDESYHTVLPDVVAEQALKIHNQYPHKRLIVHFIQPHYPFLGPTGEGINHRTITGEGLIEDDRGFKSIWRRLETGELDRSTVCDAYRENLELAIPHIENLVRKFRGRTVITSDHGNAWGEFGIYGHPQTCYIPSLVRVPWLERQGGPRKEITVDPSPTQTTPSGEVTSRLRDLGYQE